MNQPQKSLLIFALLAASSVSIAKDDVGKVGMIVANSEGGVGFELTSGMPNAKSEDQCATSNGFSGLPIDPQKAKAMLTLLLAAKATDRRVAVNISGCHKDLKGWYQAKQIYLLD